MALIFDHLIIFIYYTTKLCVVWTHVVSPQSIALTLKLSSFECWMADLFICRKKKHRANVYSFYYLTDKAKREQYKKAKRINKRNIHIKTKTRGIFAAQIMPIHKQKHGYKIANFCCWFTNIRCLVFRWV